MVSINKTKQRLQGGCQTQVSVLVLWDRLAGLGEERRRLEFCYRLTTVTDSPGVNQVLG